MIFKNWATAHTAQALMATVQVLFPEGEISRFVILHDLITLATSSGRIESRNK